MASAAQPLDAFPFSSLGDLPSLADLLDDAFDDGCPLSYGASLASFSEPGTVPVRYQAEPYATEPQHKRPKLDRSQTHHQDSEEDDVDLQYLVSPDFFELPETQWWTAMPEWRIFPAEALQDDRMKAVLLSVLDRQTYAGPRCGAPMKTYANDQERQWEEQEERERRRKRKHAYLTQ